MFESTAALLDTGECDPAWVAREPLPGEPGYEAYLAYEAQQIAFWNTYAESAAQPEDVLPNLNGARTQAGLLGEIARQARRENAAAGAKLRAVADYAFRTMAQPVVGYDEHYLKRSVEAEVALALRLPPSTASNLVGLALTLAKRLPQTFAALEEGELNQRAADLIADETANLNIAQCAHLEQAVLPDAGQRSYRSLQARVRREVERLDADAVRKRAEKARDERTLWLKDEHDGMATLCLYAPAGVARAIYDAVNDRVLAGHAARLRAAASEGCALAARDERPVGAQRHDTVVDLLATALGIDPWEAPAPVPPSPIRVQIPRLNQHASTYRPSEGMKVAVRNRDKHCRFPGCRRPARQTDLDHTIPFVKVGSTLVGPGTVYENLGCLCRFHHQIKQLPGWHLEQDDRGRFTWTTPNGMRFVVHPPPVNDDGDEQSDFAPVNPADDIPPF